MSRDSLERQRRLVAARPIQVDCSIVASSSARIDRSVALKDQESFGSDLLVAVSERIDSSLLVPKVISLRVIEGNLCGALAYKANPQGRP
jgi:hypothetical protein